MPEFSKKSINNLEQVHPLLIDLFSEVVRHWDCTIIEGIRSPEQQAIYVKKGVSKTYKSKHLLQSDNYAWAVDVAPYPVKWHDISRFYAFAGFVLGIATSMKIPIRWGGDWDSDREFTDQKFNDLVHFELVSSEQ